MFPIGRAGAAELPELLSSLSDDELLGQLFLVAIDTEIAARYEDDIRAGRLGGGLLRWDKFTGEEALRFTSRLKDLALASRAKIPFLVAADHEGGPMFTQRSYGATIFPGNMALGAAGSALLAERAAEASARELRALGIHVNFAPVADVNSNPDNPIIGIRAFGEAPEAVGKLVAAAVRGALRGGVLPVVKHFPGHGDTSEDSHSTLPVVLRRRPLWEQVELPPFKAAIAAGAPMIMPAHIAAPALGEGPVTLSTAVLQGVLRRELGFEGVIVSDSMDMGAITKNYGEAEAALSAFLAGCDLLLLGKADYRKVFGEFRKALASGRLPRERLRDSVGRILAAKASLSREAEPAFAEVGRKEHQDLAAEIAEGSLTALKDDAGLLPLKLDSGKKLFAVMFRSPRYALESDFFLEELKLRHPRMEYHTLPPSPTSAAATIVLGRARRADALIVGTYHWGRSEYVPQSELVRALLRLGKPVVLVSAMNPYDLRFYPEAKTVLASYGVTRASLKAVVGAIFGDFSPRGSLPVTIPGAYPIGTGLSRK